MYLCIVPFHDKTPYVVIILHRGPFVYCPFLLGQVSLKNQQAVDGLFTVLSAGEFESCVFPKTPKSSESASPVRYFMLPVFLDAMLLFYFH